MFISLSSFTQFNVANSFNHCSETDKQQIYGERSQVSRLIRDKKRREEVRTEKDRRTHELLPGSFFHLVQQNLQETERMEREQEREQSHARERHWDRLRQKKVQKWQEWRKRVAKKGRLDSQINETDKMLSNLHKYGSIWLTDADAMDGDSTIARGQTNIGDEKTEKKKIDQAYVVGRARSNNTTEEHTISQQQFDINHRIVQLDKLLSGEGEANNKRQTTRRNRSLRGGQNRLDPTDHSDAARGDDEEDVHGIETAAATHTAGANLLRMWRWVEERIKLLLTKLRDVNDPRAMQLRSILLQEVKDLYQVRKELRRRLKATRVEFATSLTRLERHYFVAMSQGAVAHASGERQASIAGDGGEYDNLGLRVQFSTDFEKLVHEEFEVDDTTQPSAASGVLVLSRTAKQMYARINKEAGRAAAARRRKNALLHENQETNYLRSKGKSRKTDSDDKRSEGRVSRSTARSASTVRKLTSRSVLRRKKETEKTAEQKAAKMAEIEETYIVNTDLMKQQREREKKKMKMISGSFSRSRSRSFVFSPDRSKSSRSKGQDGSGGAGDHDHEGGQQHRGQKQKHRQEGNYFVDVGGHFNFSTDMLDTSIERPHDKVSRAEFDDSIDGEGDDDACERLLTADDPDAYTWKHLLRDPKLFSFDDETVNPLQNMHSTDSSRDVSGSDGDAFIRGDYIIGSTPTPEEILSFASPPSTAPCSPPHTSRLSSSIHPLIDRGKRKTRVPRKDRTDKLLNTQKLMREVNDLRDFSSKALHTATRALSHSESLPERLTQKSLSVLKVEKRENEERIEEQRRKSHVQRLRRLDQMRLSKLNRLSSRAKNQLYGNINIYSQKALRREKNKKVSRSGESCEYGPRPRTADAQTHASFRSGPRLDGVVTEGTNGDVSKRWHHDLDPQHQYHNEQPSPKEIRSGEISARMNGAGRRHTVPASMSSWRKKHRVKSITAQVLSSSPSGVTAMRQPSSDRGSTTQFMDEEDREEGGQGKREEGEEEGRAETGYEETETSHKTANITTCTTDDDIVETDDTSGAVEKDAAGDSALSKRSSRARFCFSQDKAQSSSSAFINRPHTVVDVGAGANADSRPSRKEAGADAGGVQKKRADNDGDDAHESGGESKRNSENTHHVNQHGVAKRNKWKKALLKAASVQKLSSTSRTATGVDPSPSAHRSTHNKKSNWKRVLSKTVSVTQLLSASRARKKSTTRTRPSDEKRRKWKSAGAKAAVVAKLTAVLKGRKEGLSIFDRLAGPSDRDKKAMSFTKAIQLGKVLGKLKLKRKKRKEKAVPETAIVQRQSMLGEHKDVYTAIDVLELPPDRPSEGVLSRGYEKYTHTRASDHFLNKSKISNDNQGMYVGTDSVSDGTYRDTSAGVHVSDGDSDSEGYNDAYIGRIYTGDSRSRSTSLHPRQRLHRQQKETAERRRGLSLLSDRSRRSSTKDTRQSIRGKSVKSDRAKGSHRREISQLSPSHSHNLHLSHYHRPHDHDHDHLGNEFNDMSREHTTMRDHQNKYSQQADADMHSTRAALQREKEITMNKILENVRMPTPTSELAYLEETARAERTINRGKTELYAHTGDDDLLGADALLGTDLLSMYIHPARE